MTKYTGIQETMWCELTLHIFTSGNQKWNGINIVAVWTVLKYTRGSVFYDVRQLQVVCNIVRLQSQKTLRLNPVEYIKSLFAGNAICALGVFSVTAHH